MGARGGPLIIAIAIARTTARGQWLEARGWELELETSNGAQTLHFVPQAWWRISLPVLVPAASTSSILSRRDGLD